IALEFAGVRVGVAQLATTLARWWGDEDPRSVAFTGIDPKHRNLVALGGFYPAYQLGGRQYLILADFDLEDVRVEQAQQFFLERPDGTGDTHQGQHQPSGDAKEPVQLKQRLLHHIVHLVLPPGGARRALCLGTRKPRASEWAGLSSSVVRSGRWWSAGQCARPP